VQLRNLFDANPDPIHTANPTNPGNHGEDGPKLSPAMSWP